MDYCLLEDAFKIQTEPGEKAKKHERKKMKKTKDCFKMLDPDFNPEAIDPDRPAYGKQIQTLSPKALSEAFTDISANKIPNIALMKTTKLPSHFLGYEDDAIEGFTNTFSVEKGFEKATGVKNDLPLPSLNDSWKPLSSSTTSTSYFESMPTPGGTYPIWNKLQYEPRPVDGLKTTNHLEQQLQQSQQSNDLQQKIDLLLKRLDDLEKESKRSPKENQNEIIAFVGTGVFVILALSLLRH